MVTKRHISDYVPPHSAESRTAVAHLARIPCAAPARSTHNTTILQGIMPPGVIAVIAVRHQGVGRAQTHVNSYPRHNTDMQGSWCLHGPVDGAHKIDTVLQIIASPLFSRLVICEGQHHLVAEHWVNAKVSLHLAEDVASAAPSRLVIQLASSELWRSFDAIDSGRGLHTNTSGQFSERNRHLTVVVLTIIAVAKSRNARNTIQPSRLIIAMLL